MKKLSIILLSVASFYSCQKWTEVQSNAVEYEDIANANLREVRDNFKWAKEDEIKKESKEALEKYWEQLREYKRRAWLNGGDQVGQKPMFYIWYGSHRWQASPGVTSSFLQAIPDTVTAISLWGGFGKRPGQIPDNMKHDLEMFHKKGSAVLLCWQTSGAGLGLPGKIDGTKNGWDYFREKYPFDTEENIWPEIYARDLARFIIACDFDGYDVDWETCGDHGRASRDGHNLMVSENNYERISKFCKEMAKYFGPVGENFYVKTQEDRQRNIEALFNPATEGFSANEADFINEFKPHLPENYLTKRYYFCADVPCGQSPEVFSNQELFRQIFDKHFMQDYSAVGVGGHIGKLGGVNYNSTGLDIQTQRSSSGFQQFWKKGEAINNKEIWGFGFYHGEIDYENTYKTREIQNYLNQKGGSRNYSNHAILREIIRLADPRRSYLGYQESEPLIILP